MFAYSKKIVKIKNVNIIYLYWKGFRTLNSPPFKDTAFFHSLTSNQLSGVNQELPSHLVNFGCPINAVAMGETQ